MGHHEHLWLPYGVIQLPPCPLLCAKAVQLGVGPDEQSIVRDSRSCRNGLLEIVDAKDLPIAKYCWETNTSYPAVKLMLDLGFPVAHPERSHGYTPLHNAAWAGSGDLVELLIARGHPVGIRDPAFDATPLGYALHDCLVAMRHPEGEFPRVVKALLEAGSPLKGVHYPTGHAEIDEVLRPYVQA